MRSSRSIRLVFAVASIAGAAILPPQARSAPAEGKVAINYNRCGDKYDGWGLHAWTGSTPLPGISWQNPMMPTAKSDFGVVWELDLAKFGTSGAVNYIIHKGDAKDQGGKDMRFDGNKIKEIWVNSDDREIYTSLEDAKKAREANPCK